VEAVDWPATLVGPALVVVVVVVVVMAEERTLVVAPEPDVAVLSIALSRCLSLAT